MKQYILDCKEMSDRNEAYAYIIQTLELAEYTSHTLDGLWDSLWDFSGEIIIEKARLLYANLGEYGLRLLDIFGDLQKDGHRVHIEW